MNENGLTPLRTFTELLRSEGYKVDRDGVSIVLKPLGITPKPMTNGKAKGLNRRDQATIRAFFAPTREPVGSTT